MTKAITQGIQVSVETHFCGMKQHLKQKHFVFDYFITIENLSLTTVQLLSRYWEIYDSLNQPEIVQGDGVIGQQPVLKPGQKHAYKSGCILSSNCGCMKGYYTMLDLEKNSIFSVKIPTFQLQTESILN